MGDWASEILSAKKEIREQKRVLLKLPSYFNFKDHDAYDFNKALSFFNWNLSNIPVTIDFKDCKSANYQTLSLVVL